MYLDPGFGSMIIQLIVAFIAAGGAYFLMFRNRIKSIFTKKNIKEQEQQNNIINEDSK